jgi:hypothetical protein
MRPLPAKVRGACACQNRAPTQSTTSPEIIEEKTLSGSQSEAPSSISDARKQGLNSPLAVCYIKAHGFQFRDGSVRVYTGLLL